MRSSYTDLRSYYLAFIKKRYGRVCLDLFAGDGVTAARTAAIDQVYVPPCFRPAHTSADAVVALDRSMLRSAQLPSRRRYEWEGAGRLVQDRETILTVRQLLERYPHAFVTGGVGTGKSALVAHVAWEAAREEDASLPLCFNLRAGVSATGTPRPVQPDDWQEELDGPRFREFLEREPCLLLLDGLDEAPEADREPLLHAVRTLVHRYPAHRFLITSRPDALPPAWLQEPFRRVVIEGLDASRVEHWTRRFFRAARAQVPAAVAAHQFIERIRDSDSLFAGQLSPLLLKALANVQCEGHDLNREPHLVCHRSLRLLLEEWDASKGIAEIFLLEFKLRVLQPLALWLLRSGRSEAPAGEFESIAGQRGEDLGLRPEYIAPLLEEIARRNGLLVPRHPGHLSFAYPWLQHYLAARELTQDPDGIDELLDHVGDPEWEKVCVLYASQADASCLIGLLLNADDPFQRHLLLAGGCAAVARRLAPVICRQVVSHLIELDYSSAFEPLTSQACKLLARIDSNAARAYLQELLQGDREDKQRQVFAILGAATVPGLDVHLEQALRTAPSRHVRATAAEALGRLSMPNGDEPLRAALDDPSWEVRCQALISLGWMATTDLTPLFAAALDCGFWCARQQRAAARFAELFSTQEARILRQSAEDKDAFVRLSAARALGALDHDDAAALLRSRLVHPNAHVRISAAYGILMTGEPEATRVLEKNVEHPDESVRYAVAGILGGLTSGHFPESRFLGLAEALLGDKSWRVRGAVLSNWRLDSDALLHMIEADVEHPIAYVHVRAVRALGHIRTPRVTERLLALLASTTRDGQVLAASNSLCLHRCIQAEPLVLERLEEGFSENVIPGLLYYLLELGTSDALSRLVGYLHNPAAEVRGLAFEAARRICHRHGIVPPPEIVEAIRHTPQADTAFMRRYDTAMI